MTKYVARYAEVLGSPVLELDLSSSEWVQVLDATPMGPDIRYRIVVHRRTLSNSELHQALGGDVS